MIISPALLDEVKRKCYITDTSETTNNRLVDVIKDSLPTVKRMIGVSTDFNFEAEGNEEELKLFKNYCWYVWNDLDNEFKDNYLDDINSLHHKHEVEQYDTEEENQ